MNTLVRRTRGALGMGLTWALGWALAGIAIGASSNVFTWLPWDAFFEVYDAPLPTLAIPGFVGGVIFSLVLGVAARRRRFHELSIPQFAAWGALGGLLVSLVPALVLGAGGGSTEGSPHSLWYVTAVIAGPFTVLSAASAAISLALARRAEQRGSIGSGTTRGALPSAAAAALRQRLASAARERRDAR
jgi:hypothetical protein